MSETPLFDFKEFPVLETERLVLREIVLADADALMRIRGDYAVTRLNIGAAYISVEQARSLVRRMAQLYQVRKELRWGITLKEQGGATGSTDAPVVGMVGFNYWDRRDRRGSVGFDLARAYWGRGIMREALREAVLPFGFARMGLNRIEAETSTENAASIRLLEALGFAREGCKREQYFDEDAFHDLLLFSLLRRDPAAESLFTPPPPPA
mgnify:FL=1